VRLLSAGHQIHGHDQVVARNPITYGPIRIGRGAWIAGGATVLEGLSIGEGAVVGAGSVVAHDVPAFAVAMGNPARVVHYREGHAPIRPWWRRLVPGGNRVR
jgi:galactoside O-acetyltransferase